MKPRRFVIEAVMLAVYGHLFVPKRPVEYMIPYSTISELYELRITDERIMPDPEDDQHAKKHVDLLIELFERPFNKKKIDRALGIPWRQSAPLLINEQVSIIIINGMDSMQYGETFDPIETELILTCIREQAPLLTDQIEYVERLIQHEVPIPIYDIEDYEYALEHTEE
ncbi:ADP-heptose synthase [Paenibacillus sp. SC116]|uniref:ADP-heptose synthase n=1 Tax=Paenibacillus sp. SC116 TaxID=2968986 RepID=UPI00215A4A85|nr:ADP-heptose synthase [Paenibacillus sp. SC116]MCR8844674.1 ADP-heptose synthase [Paenibacillus sp. SC116]